MHGRRGHAWQSRACMTGGVHDMGGGNAWWGACMAGGMCVAGEMAIRMDGTYPTGMHSSQPIRFLDCRSWFPMATN